MQRLLENTTQNKFFWLFGFFSIACCLASFFFDQIVFLGAPFIVGLAFLTVANVRLIYYLLLFCIPLSIEIYFSNGLATDLPTEPLMAGLMLITFILLARNSQVLPKGFLNHPIIIFLLAHLVWMIITAINATNTTASFKVVLAKTWYIVPFTFLTAIVLKKKEHIKTVFWVVFIPLTTLIAVSMFRHGVFYGFAFDEINHSVTPYFRNHVNYAAIISIFFPFIFIGRRFYAKESKTYKFLTASLVFYVIAIYFSYTRTCMLAIMAMIPFYFVLQWKLTKLMLAVAFAGMLGMAIYLFSDNRYLKFSPDYKQTIYHDDFSSHLTSTFEGEDVSSMERIYRWIAAVRMIPERPWMGIGCGNFYENYQRYTVSAFKTYISDNEEHSTVHNYYLLLLCEQGVPGLLFFLGIVSAVFVYGQSLYSRLKNATNKFYVLILLQVVVSLMVNLLLSDVMEADKVGPFFFLTIALVVLADREILLLEPEGE